MIIIGLALVLATVSWPARGAESSGLRKIGVLKNGATSIVADPRHRWLYESLAASNRLVIRDLDTLRVIRQFTVPTGLIVSSGLTRVDEAKGRLVVAYRPAVAAPFRLAVVDGRRGMISDSLATAPVSGTPDRAVFNLLGIDYDAATLSVLMTWQVPGLVRLTSNDVMTGVIRWTLPFDGCTAIPAAAGYAVGSKFILAPCQSGRPVGAGFEPGASYVVRIPVSNGRPGIMQRFLVTGAIRGMGIDRSTGRAAVATAATQNGAYVFDTARGVYIALLVGLFNPIVEPHLGRMYGCGFDSTLLVSDLRVTPVSAGSLLKFDCGNAVVADDSTRRLFLQQKQGEWTIYRDEIERALPVPGENPDAGTIDVAERAGFTESSYSASGSAYGSVATFVGGPEGAIQNYATNIGYKTVEILAGGVAVVTRDLPPPYSGRSFGYPKMPLGPRTVWAARVNEVTLEDGNATAAAIAADRNEYVETDMKYLQHPEQFGVDPNTNPADGKPVAEASWPYDPLACQRYGASTDVPTASDGDVELTCATDRAEGKATAPIRFEQPSLFSAGTSNASVKVRRDPKLGAVVVAHAEARNIQLGGVVSIAEVTATATTLARGRPGTADSTYERTMSGVKVGNTLLCTSPEDCDKPGVLAAINQALAGRLVVRQPAHDALLERSPGGAQAVRQLDRWEQLQRVTLEGAAADDFMLPALQVEVVGDNLGQSRLLLEFAGVRAESHYRIVRIPQYTAPNAPSAAPSTVAPPSAAPPVAKPGTTTKTAATGPTVRKTTQTVIDKIRDGVRWVFGLGDESPVLAATWLLLLSPFYLAVRRRTLEAAVRRGSGAHA